MNRPKTLSPKWSIAAAAAGLIALCIVLFKPLSGQFSRVLITQSIDESNLVVLRGNTRPEANARNDRGAVPDSFPMEYMMLQLKRSPVLEAELVQYVDQLTDKKSPNFHRWLTAQQLGERYGLVQEDLSTLTGWLQSHGLTVDQVYTNRMVIAFSGTAGMIRSAFHTEIHYLDVNGHTHHANMGDPRIPAALAPAVVGVVSMHDFQPHASSVPRTDYTVAAGTYSLVPADFQTIYNVVPLYKLGLHGEGQTIVVVESSDTYGTDVATYRSKFLPQYTGTVTTTHPGTGCTDPLTNGADGEADLDAEVASAIAPNAAIVVAACTSTTATFGGLIAIQNILAAGSPPNIMSMSYGACEVVNGSTANAAFYTAFQSAVALGVSVFVSSGDAGASGCAPDFFSSGSPYAYPGIGITGWGETPYNVSVGGTDFEDSYNSSKPANGGLAQSTYWTSANNPASGSAISYIPEIPWNDSCASYLITNLKGISTTYGSSGFCNNSIATNNNAYLTTAAGAGGPSSCATGESGFPLQDLAVGTCAGYAKPTWQSGVFGNPADGVRDIPDVSLFAGNGIWGHYVVVCFSDTTQGGTSCAGAPSTWSGFGGTSIATPVMAGIQSLVNQRWGTTWTGGAYGGNPAPIYYSIAKTEFGASGNTNCYSINQPSGRRGLGTTCTFYDITQGDMDVNCRKNGTITSNCYVPSGTNGVLSTGQVTSIVPTSGGTGYTGTTGTCSIDLPSNKSSYTSPQNTTLWAGGTQATCTATVATTSTKSTSTASATTGYLPGAGTTMTVGAVTYTWVSGSPTAANQVEIPTTASEAYVAANMFAAITATSSNCGAPTSGCFGAGTVTNASVTATCTSCRAGSADVLSLTAVNNGCAVVPFTQNDSGYGVDPFALSSLSGYLAGGTLSGQICAYTVSGGGTGYQGNPICNISGTNGSGASCVAQILDTTAPTSYQPAFGAAPGWDFATGLGSVNAYNLVLNGAW